tara:strand:- start:403 stop:807 length:405 start_codon:yes stop_codon:yes gene_type:complete
MEEQKYLVALALAEQNNKRIMPLGGKTFVGVDSESQAPKKEAEKILLDLLLRLFKRTTEGNLKVTNDEIGILVAEISFKNMQNNLPKIKSNWINTGKTDTLIQELNSICSNLWSINYRKHEGMIFNKLMKKKLS